jgi:predicted Zn-dependent peptidase
MLFKGTDRRPDARTLTQLLDGVGAEFNAYTTKEFTGYYIKSAAEHLPLSLDVLSDMLWHSRFDAGELAREKKVIVEEINMYEDNPLMHIGDLLEGGVFRGSTLGTLISGTRESVTALKRPQLMHFWQSYYHPANMLLVVAGKVNSQAEHALKKWFGEKRKTGSPGKFTPFVPRPTQPHVALHFKDTEQVQLALGFPGYGYNHKRLLALELLATVLGGNMSSRLFVRLREKEGLCYSVRAGVDCYQGTGLFAVQAGLDRSRLPLAIKLIREELDKVVAEGVGEDELSHAKEYSRGRFTLALEDSAAQADWAAKRLFLEQSRETPEEHLKRLTKVTLSQVQAAAREVLNLKRATLALIGPFRKTAEWRQLLR